MKRTKTSRHHHPGDSLRWPVISNDDLRSKKARQNRPFGAAPWKARDPDNSRICERLIKIRDRERAMSKKQWRKWRGLGPRAYAYRLKAAGFIFADATTLTKEHFERVERILGRMRRDPGIKFDWADVDDGRGKSYQPSGYRDNAERIEELGEIVETDMPHIRLEGQPVVPELVVETEGLYNLIYDIAERYGARHTALQGQSSITMRYKLAQRVADRWKGGIRTRVLGVVDYDKEAGEIVGAVAADPAQHLRDMGIDPAKCFKVIRVAVTEWQIRDLKIPFAEKDGRLVQEAEALPTDFLREEVKAALRDTLDMDLFDRVAEQKAAEIDDLVQRLNGLRTR
jgi:hypothetical protein